MSASANDTMGVYFANTGPGLGEFRSLFKNLEARPQTRSRHIANAPDARPVRAWAGGKMTDAN